VRAIRAGASLKWPISCTAERPADIKRRILALRSKLANKRRLRGAVEVFAGLLEWAVAGLRSLETLPAGIWPWCWPRGS
jgi:hypothetical protein